MKPLTPGKGWAVPVAAALILVWLAVGSAGAQPFYITIENNSPNVLTPVPFITHDAGFDLFDEGSAASMEVELLAETGNPMGVTDLAGLALGGAVSDFAVASPGGPIGPGGSASVLLNTGPSHRYLSFASMFAFSNDAFIGVALGDGAIDLFPGGVPFSGVIYVFDDDVWDAGTEVNDEALGSVPALGGMGGVDEGGVITRPHPGIAGTGDVSTVYDWRGPDPVATITIAAIPEPGTLVLIALGVLGIAAAGRRPLGGRGGISGPAG